MKGFLIDCTDSSKNKEQGIMKEEGNKAQAMNHQLCTMNFSQLQAANGKLSAHTTPTTNS
jgi:hypothetical protein